eukprot:scaffold116278_cov32-Tisochrysis_lutea.AAC.4
MPASGRQPTPKGRTIAAIIAYGNTIGSRWQLPTYAQTLGAVFPSLSILERLRAPFLCWPAGPDGPATVGWICTAKTLLQPLHWTEVMPSGSLACSVSAQLGHVNENHCISADAIPASLFPPRCFRSGRAAPQGRRGRGRGARGGEEGGNHQIRFSRKLVETIL